MSESDDDFNDRIVETHVRKKRGRPKKTASRLSSSTSILIPELNDKYDSDFASSKELNDVKSDRENKEEDEVTYPEYEEEKDKYNPSLELGMKFRSLGQFKEACRNWGIKNRCQLYFPTNDQARVICACKLDDCPFRVYAGVVSNVDPTAQIKSIDMAHSGGYVFQNFHMDAQWIAKRYFSTFRADPAWSLNGIIKRLTDDYSYTISKTKVWRAKRLALKWIYGEEGAQYARLLAELLKSNPGSTVTIWRDRKIFGILCMP